MADFILDYIAVVVKILLVLAPIVTVVVGMFWLYEKRVEGSTSTFSKWSKFCDSLFGE